MAVLAQRGDQEPAEASLTELERELHVHYGLVAARFCGLPAGVVEEAERLLPSIEVKTLRCDGEGGGGG